MTIARPWRAPILIALVVVLLDQLTKHWALNALSDGHVIEVIWTLQFNLALQQRDGVQPGPRPRAGTSP